MSSDNAEKPFEPPYDTMIIKYIEEVVEKIQPVLSIKEQIEALAK